MSSLPKTFGFEKESAKGFYPYLFNTLKNQNKVLTCLLAKIFYNYDGMKPAIRKRFAKWYENHKTDDFYMISELIKYCENDVYILAEGCLCFRESFMENTKIESDSLFAGIDPFLTCLTLASVCSLVYRTLYLEKDTVAIIP